MSLRLDGVSYRYAGADTPALSGIDLVIEPGRIVGIIGPNGAGKTTLCLAAVGVAPKAIGGDLGGRVVIDELVTTDSTMHVLAQRAGILFQESQTQITSGSQTVWEEVAFGPRNLALPLDEVVRRTWSAIDALKLHDIVERDPERLSGGQAQLVALAGVLALEPRYLVLDEPTSQLDSIGTRLVGDTLIEAARATGAGVLIAEHKTDLLTRLCDEVAVVVDGSIVAHGPADAVLDDERLVTWGIAPPDSAVLRRHVESAGLRWDPRWA